MSLECSRMCVSIHAQHNIQAKLNVWTTHLAVQLNFHMLENIVL